MSVQQLTAEQTRQMMVLVSDRMIASIDVLTQADRMGDGDHGEGMARGFTAANQKLEQGSFSSVGPVFDSVGMSLIGNVGGAAGAIFGTMFREGAKGLSDGAAFDAGALSRLLSDGLEAVKKRGRAAVGQKTMVDALEPAAKKAAEMGDCDLGPALVDVTESARVGMESTKAMIATLGKAKTLGERTLGHADPGAVSMHLILKFMSEFVSAMA